MQDQRTRDALTRIDRALTRLDHALSAEAPPPKEAEELAQLKQAHTLLRSRVETAIGEIDALLAAEPEAV
jgi:hypothetical protein